MIAVESRCGAAASLQEPNDMLEEVRSGLLTAAAFNARISKNYDSVAEEYINELIRTLPNASAADIYNCFHFTVGTMFVACAESGRIERPSKGNVHSRDLEKMFDDMLLCVPKTLNPSVKVMKSAQDGT
jgi:hypothetical protein